MEIKFKTCRNCGAMVKILEDCHCKCKINCCDEIMVDTPCNIEGVREKHLPEYTIEGDEIHAVVNHVMEDEHYIKWMAYINGNEEEWVYFEPGDKAEATFHGNKGIIYAYCNNHGLWKVEI